MARLNQDEQSAPDGQNVPHKRHHPMLDFMQENARIIAGSTALIAGLGAMTSAKIVPAGSYGVDIKSGQMKSDHLRPDLYWTTPFLWGSLPFGETIYTLNNNTIILELNGVGSGRNSSDQNSVTGDFRFHYKINPKIGSIALNINKITDNHGQDLLTDMATKSYNAVVGARPATDTLADPTGTLQAFKTNFEWRMAQFSLPVGLDSIEYLTAYVGHGEHDAGLRKVIQMRIKSNGEVEEMAGPAAVSVSAGGATVNPSAVKVTPQSSVTGPTVPTAPVGTSSKPAGIQP